MPICINCKYDFIKLFPEEKVCVDCYWDMDAERKSKLRNNPKWVFNRAYSSAVALLGKTHEEALVTARLTVEHKFGK